MSWIIAFGVAYLVGSISSSYFLGRIFLHKDLSKLGSGNLGAKNSFEIGGALFGVSVFLLDLLKGALVLLWIRATYDNHLLLYMGALGVVLGHNYSLYIGFRGGKGLASMVGVLLVINTNLLLVMGALAGLMALLTRDAGVAAILAVIPFALIHGLIVQDWASLPFTLLLTVIVLSKHRRAEYIRTAEFLRLR